MTPDPVQEPAGPAATTDRAGVQSAGVQSAAGPAAAGPAAVDPAAVDPAAVDPAAVTDPAAAAAALGLRLAASTARLTDTAARLTDAQVRQDSLLPGWSRGHLLTHLARNADSIANLLIWARTRTETPQYASQDAREEGISDGAHRRAAELLDDLQASSAALTGQAALLSAADWGYQVHGLGGNAHPAWYSLWRRLTETEIHHADLGAGYSPGDWPEDFAVQCLARVAADFTDRGAPAVVLHSDGDDREYQIGPPGTAPGTQISGGSRALLAWLTGRGNGTGLRSQPAGPLPELPSW
jgi:maleylpyruvate isomerase